MSKGTNPAPPKAPGDTMKAIVRYEYGSPEVLEFRDIAKPEIADEEVLVRVRAAGVDRGVWHIMTGLAYPIRLAGFGLRAPKNPVIGMDLAGVVEAIGKDVSRFHPSDVVFGIGEGSYAKYARSVEDKLASKPANLNFEQAAVLASSAHSKMGGMRRWRFSVFLLVLGYLAFRSGYIPRALGILLMIASLGYLVDGFGGILSTSYNFNIVQFTFVGEALLMVWLLWKGVRLKDPDSA